MILVAHIPHTMSLRSPYLLRALARALNIASLEQSTSAYRELIHGSTFVIESPLGDG